MANSGILNDLINKLAMSVSSFEREIGVGSSSISKAITRNSLLKKDTIQKILDKFPNVNRNWLLTGEGEMFINTNIVSEPQSEYQYKKVIALGKHAHLRLSAEEHAEAFGDWQGLPMFNAPVTASFIETYRDENEYIPQFFLKDPRFKGCSFGAIITGDSMHSEIRHGDYVICQEIQDKRFIVYGDIYYIVASNWLETCKYLNADENDSNNFMLVPRNEKISPSPIPKDMIDKLFKVRGILRGY